MPVNTRAKKFCPPLKSQPLSPALSSAPQSQESTANTGDSLPDTQTHTVLSYCDSYQAEEPSTPLLCVEQPSTPLLCEDVPSNEDSLSSSNNSSLCSASEEIDENENIEQTSRFKPHKRDRLPVGYGYGILQHNQNKKKKTVADLERGTRGKKRVRISTPLAGVEKGKRLCGRDLSVYDYQPTPPEAGGVVKRQAVDVSGYCSSREEQLVIDREVIAAIKKTRLELQEIRERCTSKHHRPTPLQFVGVISKPLPLVFMSSGLTLSEE